METRKVTGNKKDDKTMWAPGLSPGRIEALSDGVFAIAMTLLVIELSVPHFLGSGDPVHPTNLWEMRGEFYNYAIGFLSLGIYWTLHHYIFYFIKRSDGVLTWLNITYLACTSLVPFWTEVLNSNEGIFRVILSYGIYMIFTFFVLLVILEYATRDYRLIDRDIDTRTISILKKVILIGSSIVAIGVLFSHFTPYAGYLLLVAGSFFVITTAYGRHRPQSKKKAKKDRKS
jgi:uncharacterized membrane protein